MPNFTRTTEDFTCMHCGHSVVGDGYTNHCPKCLHSRHVDVNPGDRAATCGGLMVPVGIENKGDRYVILHRCTACGFERRNKMQDDDDMDRVIAISRMNAQSTMRGE
jgi:hypothetical protein